MTATAQTTVAVKNIKLFKELSEETQAFSATIHINGRKAGSVTNEGRGGCNFYHFDTREQREQFDAHVERWAAETGQTGIEPEDVFIAQLIDDFNDRREARKLIRKGAGQVLLIEKAPGWFTGERTGKPDYYDDTYLLGVAASADPATVAASENADRWRVIEIA